MAVTLADAIVYLAADNTQLKKDLAVAKGETQTWTGAVSTMAGNLLSRGIAGAISIATTAAMELGAALKEAVVDSVKLAGSFESQVAELGIAAKASGLSTEELHDAALAVGGDTNLLGVSATGAADAMTTLFKAGLDAGEIFGDLGGYMAGTTELGGALGASINLAAASGMDMVQAAELAAVSLATYGGELTTSEERSRFIAAAMDNLVKSADASVAEVDGLGQALSFVGSTAFDAGISFEDTNNALAIMSSAGLDAGRAGRNLQSMLGSLQNPSDAAKGAMHDLGIEIYNTSDGSMKSMQEIIGELTGGTEGLTQKERDLALGVLFTNAGVRAALPLMNAGAEGWDDMAEATENATGINEQAAIKAATLAGRMEALEGNVETLKIEIGEKLLPYLTDFVNWMIPFIDEYGPVVVEIFGNLVEQAENLWKAFEPLAEPVTALMEAFTGLMAALGIDTGEGVGWFGKFLGGIVMDQVTAWINGLTMTIESLTAAMDVARGVIEWFKGAWDTLGNIQLPPWLVPGSPTPFELGVRGITDAMADLSSIGAPQLQTAFNGLGGQTTNNIQNYNLTAQYQDRQSPGSLADEVRALSILTAGA